MATYIEPDFNERLKRLSEWISEQIDNEIMDKILADIERDREIVKGIIPDKLFEV